MISFSRKKPIPEAAALAYARVVEQARQPRLFTDYGVPDTLDGRFELICLFAFLYLHRLKSERPHSAALSQAFFDTLFADMDRSLRELGTGDLRVGREIRRMAEALYGRIRAYEAGLEGDDEALGAALARNLYGTVAPPPEGLGAIGRYLRLAAAALRHEDAAELLLGRVRFAAVPPLEGAR
ncbi:MAG TPA: ubiquinol-cytochrome C chaperone family protein [Stellaceae bacterium]|nr:ubiquinol-cytochrome C chaperone family protein [Stellaceae bacterium]